MSFRKKKKVALFALTVLDEMAQDHSITRGKSREVSKPMSSWKAFAKSQTSVETTDPYFHCKWGFGPYYRTSFFLPLLLQWILTASFMHFKTWGTLWRLSVLSRAYKRINDSFAQRIWGFLPSFLMLCETPKRDGDIPTGGTSIWLRGNVRKAVLFDQGIFWRRRSWNSWAA